MSVFEAYDPDPVSTVRIWLWAQYCPVPTGFATLINSGSVHVWEACRRSHVVKHVAIKFIFFYFHHPEVYFG
jgi:hypothetical protein